MLDASTTNMIMARFDELAKQARECFDRYATKQGCRDFPDDGGQTYARHREELTKLCIQSETANARLRYFVEGALVATLSMTGDLVHD